MPTRYATPLKAMPNIGVAAVHAGRCPNGHDLALPDAVSRGSGGYRCRACWYDVRGPALCKLGKHPLAAGVKRCPTCAKEEHEGPKDMSYLFVGLPPVDVIHGAACGPDEAGWFDPVEHSGAVSRLPPNTLAAMAICSMCPVKAQCLADALEWRREGVWGGAYFTRRWHQANRSAQRAGTRAPALRTLAYQEKHSDRVVDVLDTLDTPDTGAVA